MKIFLVVIAFVVGSLSLNLHAESAPATTVGPWAETEARVTSLKAKKKVHEDNIIRLLEERRSGSADPKKSIEISRAIRKEYQELRTIEREYNQELSNLKFRFPERYQRDSTSQTTSRLPTLDKIEEELTLTQVLDQATKKIHKKYSSKKPPKNAADNRAPASTKENQEVVFPVIRLEK